MTLSYRAAPVQLWNNRDQIWMKSFPWPTPAGDPGLGGGGSESITVKFGAGDYRLAWSVNLGSAPPAGFGYPAQPTMTGSEPWWIHGIHGYGRVTWSPNYGVVVSGVCGLRQNGTVGHINAFFHHSDGINPEHCWRYMAPYYGSGGEGGSNSWDYHLGFDWTLQKDLVVVKEERRVYQITGEANSVSTRGAAVWTQTAAHVAAGYSLACDSAASGLDRVNLSWRNEWWICQVLDAGDGSAALIWGFNRTQSGDSSAFSVTIPAAARSRLTASFPDNLCLSVDQSAQRVFAAQADVLATPIVQNGRTKYPLLLWEINAATHVWTQVTLTSTLYVTPPGKSRGHNPLCWTGGFRWIYWDVRGDAGANIYWQTPSAGYSEGGFRPVLIYIPKTGAPRNITFTSRPSGSVPGVLSGNEWVIQKHTEHVYRPANGRMYQHGGDMFGSGSQMILSYEAENPSGTLTVEQAMNFTGQEFRPANPDEHGWQIRSDEFWMMYGYPYPTDINGPGNLRHGTWPYAANQNVGAYADATGGTNVLWKWNPTTRIWTTHQLLAASGFSGPFGLETIDPLSKMTSSHQKRWYYDSSADRMVIAAYGGSVQYQTPCVKFIEFVGGEPRYRVIPANRLTNGATILPDGRQISSGLWGEDSAAIDSATGYLYVFANPTGDLYRIQTWTAPGNYAYPTYTHPTEGYPVLPVEWCCKLPATPGTGNVVKLTCMHGAVWVVMGTASNRARVFSWAPGDAHGWEHDTPFGMGMGSIGKYQVGGVDRMIVLHGGVIKTQRNGPPWEVVFTGVVS